MNEPGVDVDVDVLARNDWDPCCHWDDPECEVTATWIGTWPCCGSKVLMCDDHHEASVEALRARLRHVRCRTIVDHLLWLSLPRRGGGPR